VKSALIRALALPEGSIKHVKIQSLTGLVCTMIESCPSSQSQASIPAMRQHQFTMNNMVKIMLKKGLVTDLARYDIYLKRFNLIEMKLLNIDKNVPKTSLYFVITHEQLKYYYMVLSTSLIKIALKCNQIQLKI